MKQRHLFLITNYRPDEQFSMLQFSDLMQRAAEEGGWRVTCLAPEEKLGRGRNTQQGSGKYFGYADKYALAPRSFRRALQRATAAGDPPSLIHIADHSNGIYGSCFPGVPVVVTCHDLIAVRRALGEFPIGKPGRLGQMQQRWILNSLRRTQHVAFDSSASRADFLRLTGSAWRTDTVIFPCLAQKLSAIDQAESRRRLEAAGLRVKGRFILHHGNASWYKNREQVIAVFLELRAKHPDIELVCSGAKLTDEQRQAVQKAGVSQAVQEAGSVSVELLEALYSSAATFLFPSWLEGFGWPPVEAQSCGCPVVASNAGSLAEVLGDSALLAEPENKQGLLNHVAAVLNDEALAADLRSRGQQNVTRFTRQVMAKAYVNFYERILTGESVAQPAGESLVAVS